MLPDSSHYWLTNAHVPDALLVRSKQGRSRNWSAAPSQALLDDLLRVDLEIVDGYIASIATAGTLTVYGAPAFDLHGGMVFPCFVDIHTHLDKGHTWERSPNPDGTFASALKVAQTTSKTWDARDLYRRMEFGLRCSFAHGTQAIRTHIDVDEFITSKLDVFATLQQEWADRVMLQASCLTTLDHYATPQGETLADQMAELNGLLGGVAFMAPDLDAQLDRLFSLARERKLNVDLHTDETNDPESTTLHHIAAATIRHHYQGKVLCGHGCSLAVQESSVAKETIALVKKAGISIVSLPLCNLYLQDRQPGRTPRWRGVTLLHELHQAGVPVAIASDNCRDPFHAFGDHDAFEVFSMSVKIAHLDRPYTHWCRSITSTPADLMGYPMIGRIGVGLSADLVLFRARRYSELFSRPQSDRVVLRAGQPIDTTLPDYAELDDLESEAAKG